MQLREAASFVRSQTWLWATLVMAAVALLVFLGPVEVLLPFRVKEQLGASAGAFGLVLASMGLGSTIGVHVDRARRAAPPAGHVPVLDLGRRDAGAVRLRAGQRGLAAR